MQNVKAMGVEFSVAIRVVPTGMVPFIWANDENGKRSMRRKKKLKGTESIGFYDRFCILVCTNSKL